jgi:nitric oxide reductase subunit B
LHQSGGIIGTLHHLYFSGTPTVAIAFGSVFSALEIVPLLLVGHEAVANIRRSKARLWLSEYKWVVYLTRSLATRNAMTTVAKTSK